MLPHPVHDTMPQRTVLLRFYTTETRPIWTCYPPPVPDIFGPVQTDLRPICTMTETVLALTSYHKHSTFVVFRSIYEVTKTLSLTFGQSMWVKYYAFYGATSLQLNKYPHA